MMSNFPRIVVLTGSLSQPRIIKRIVSLKNAGFRIEVYGYDRRIYDCNALPADIPLTVLGRQSEGRGYAKKIVQLFRDTHRITGAEKNARTVYYTFGFLEALMLKRRGVPYIYEISDIAYGYDKYDVIRPLLRSFDRGLVKRSLLTIMTSPGFSSFLFGANEPQNVIIQPNKLNASFIHTERKKSFFESTSSLTFAFVGAIRYPDTILRFAKTVGRFFPQHRFFFYGDGPKADEFREATAGFENVRFFGAFKNPDDLPQIYASIDIVVACYENKSLNEKIAEPNKLYEAIFFCKPIVVSAGTFLEEQLRRFRCGFAIDAYSDDAIREFIASLTPELLNTISSDEYAVAKEMLIDSPKAIVDRLKTICN